MVDMVAIETTFALSVELCQSAIGCQSASQDLSKKASQKEDHPSPCIEWQIRR